MNHKWIAEKEHEYGTKPHYCKRCGINKKWLGGDMQCWEYSWINKTGVNYFGETTFSIKTSFIRPICYPENNNTAKE